MSDTKSHKTNLETSVLHIQIFLAWSSEGGWHGRGTGEM